MSKIKISYCICGIIVKATSQTYGKYCSISCSNEGKREKYRQLFKKGLIRERSTLKKYVTECHGYKCSECTISEYNGKPLSLQLDHIDGCAANNMPDNLRLLCPNCHSQTPHYGAKNKGKGRTALGLPTR